MKLRTMAIKSLPCVACQIEGLFQPSVTEEHHLNEHGMAGKKRRGEVYTIPLCGWHHRGDTPVNMTASKATFEYGPSLARSSKRFRETYGSDDELLRMTNEELE